MTKIKNFATIILLGLLIFLLPVIALCTPDRRMLEAERREAKQFPDLTLQTVYSVKFMKEFETYTAEQFPARDAFRSVKAYTARRIFAHRDVNDLILTQDQIVKMEYPYHPDSVEYALGRFSYVYDTLLKDADTRVYLSVIPDKNYFTPRDTALKLDYDRLIGDVRKGMAYAEYIDIFPLLDIADYYATDTHWKQPDIVDVADRLAQSMGVTLPTEYDVEKAEVDFYGVYYGQAALPFAPDALEWLVNPTIRQLTAFDFETDRPIPVYDRSKLSGDPYELFLCGSKSLISIDNPSAETEKRLILFRDSFGSSIAPLLAQGYRNVTLVDIRYIQPAILEQYISFANADVLFLYSTSVFNNSQQIK